ncbi:MAG: rhomboid family intramembrane serine protease [Anaerolineales bacterium]
MSAQTPTESPSQPIQRGYPIPAVAPRVTYVFLAANLLVFAAQWLLRALVGPVASNLVFALGAKVNAAIVAGDYYRLLTMIFLHGGFVHVAFNSYALYVIGPSVERPFGHARFALVYLLAGITGSIFSFVFNPHPAVGASGAIFGLIGAIGVYLFSHRKIFGPQARKQLNGILMITVINLAIGLNPGIDNWAHVGGLVGGVVLGWLLGPVWRLQSDYSGQVGVMDANPLTGRWLAIAAYMLALGAALSVGIALQR